MALTTIAITAGAGTAIEVDSSASGNMQVIKLAESTLGSTSLIPADTTYGLDVDVTRVQGNVTVVQGTATNLKVDASGVAVPVTDNSASLTVDAPATVPVAVRLSTGSAFIDTIPVSIAAAVTVAGTVAVSGTAAVTQSGTWNIAAVTSITNTVTVAGTVAVSGTVTVAGTATVTQGTAAAASGAWPIKITDATNTSALQNVGGVYCVPVKVLSQTGGGYSQVDKTAFTEGTTEVEVIGGVYNDSFSGSPAAGQASVLRITAFRAAHVNIRNASGTEMGTASNPLVVVGASTGALPVSGTVAATQSGSNWSVNLAQIGAATVVSAAAGVQKVGVVDGAGTAFSGANPLQTQPAPSGATGQTIWKKAVTFATAETDITIHTPASGKVAYIEGIIITPTAAGMLLKIYDQTNSATAMIYQGMPPLSSIVITPARPIPLAAANNLLRYSTGSGAAGDITAWGYDA